MQWLPSSLLVPHGLKCLTTQERKHFGGKKQRRRHTYSLSLSPGCTTLTALLSFPLTHSTWCPAPSSRSLSAVSSTTCSTSLFSTCLYLSLASPLSLQACTPCQLFLLLSHSDPTGENSCPATIPPHSLFGSRPFLSLRLCSFASSPTSPFHSFIELTIRKCHILRYLLVYIQYVLSLSLHNRESNLLLTEKPHLELQPYWSWKV